MAAADFVDTGMDLHLATRFMLCESILTVAVDGGEDSLKVERQG